jgi:hypothetical protein
MQGLGFEYDVPRFRIIAFDEAMKNHADRLFRKSDVLAKRLLLRFREPLPALLALPVLNTILPIKARFDHLEAAIVAGHFLPCFL